MLSLPQMDTLYVMYTRLICVSYNTYIKKTLLSYVWYDVTSFEGWEVYVWPDDGRILAYLIRPRVGMFLSYQAVMWLVSTTLIMTSQYHGNIPFFVFDYSFVHQFFVFFSFVHCFFFLFLIIHDISIVVFLTFRKYFPLASSFIYRLTSECPQSY